MKGTCRWRRLSGRLALPRTGGLGVLADIGRTEHVTCGHLQPRAAQRHARTNNKRGINVTVHLGGHRGRVIVRAQVGRRI